MQIKKVINMDKICKNCGKSPEDVVGCILFQVVDERHLQKCICFECMLNQIIDTGYNIEIERTRGK